MTIPIFMITYNRLDVLKKSFQEVQKLQGDYTIVFSDNKSTYKPLITWLKEKETAGYTVIWNKSSNLYSEITNAINVWYKTNDASHFVIMDPDVVVDCPPDLLDVLTKMLALHPKLSRAGPVMRWSDIPAHYPLKQRVVKKQERLYGKRAKHTHENITYVLSDIDTTFTMFRKGFRNFKNVHSAVVTLAPYEVKHLDWYIDVNNMSEEDKTYCMNRNQFSHWCGMHLYKHVKKK
jgi:hypothetical protein